LSHRLLMNKVDAYLNSSCNSKEMIAAIRMVSIGRKYISTQQGEHFANLIIRSGSRYTQISSREFQVMNLLLEGKTVTEIAGDLRLSMKTISTFRHRLLTKLNLKNEVELARFSH